MTQTYTWNPMPHVLAVRCPKCSSEAVFEFAETAWIERNADVPYFEASKDFDVIELYSHGRKKVAVFWHQLGRPLHAIEDLPDGYDHSRWDHSRYLVRKSTGDPGTIVCANCGLRRKHLLEWPGDAFFQIDYRAEVLWAFDRSSMVALIDFVSSKERDNSSDRPWGGFLFKIPAHFLTAKAREPVLRKLRAKLGMQSR